jgi:hypothetical protein
MSHVKMDGAENDSIVNSSNGELVQSSSDIMRSGSTVLLENPINAHECEIKFVLLKYESNL